MIWASISKIAFESSRCDVGKSTSYFGGGMVAGKSSTYVIMKYFDAPISSLWLYVMHRAIFFRVWSTIGNDFCIGDHFTVLQTRESFFLHSNTVMMTSSCVGCNTYVRTIQSVINKEEKLWWHDISMNVNFVLVHVPITKYVDCSSSFNCHRWEDVSPQDTTTYVSGLQVVDSCPWCRCSKMSISIVHS